MPEAEYSSTSDIVLRAHGVIMSIVFLAGYPLGAVLMTMIGKWFIHAGWQVIVFVGMWAGFALGYVYARNDSDVSEPGQIQMH
jgi:F0F1-type ATP synthase assembly protein I